MNSSEFARIVVGTLVVLSGLSSGAMLTIALPQSTDKEPTPDFWTERQNVNDRFFRKLMPRVFPLILIAAGTSAILLHHGGRVLMLVSLVAELVVIIVTGALEVPLNKQIEQWRPGAIPLEWHEVRTKWDRNHRLRTYFALAAFLCAVVALSSL